MSRKPFYENPYWEGFFIHFCAGFMGMFVALGILNVTFFLRTEQFLCDFSAGLIVCVLCGAFQAITMTLVYGKEWTR